MGIDSLEDYGEEENREKRNEYIYFPNPRVILDGKDPLTINCDEELTDDDWDKLRTSGIDDPEQAQRYYDAVAEMKNLIAENSSYYVGEVVRAGMEYENNEDVEALFEFVKNLIGDNYEIEFKRKDNDS